jgi:hypothetical protein
MVDLFTNLLGREPEQTGEVYVWWNIR